jgi:hypothetical protein
VAHALEEAGDRAGEDQREHGADGQAAAGCAGSADGPGERAALHDPEHHRQTERDETPEQTQAQGHNTPAAASPPTAIAVVMAVRVVRS